MHIYPFFLRNFSNNFINILVPLTTHFNFSFDAIVWRIIPDKVADFLLLELRDDLKKEVRYMGVDLLTARLLPELQISEQSWWTGVEDLVDNNVLLHGYESEENPTHQGLYCFDLLSGEMLWENGDGNLVQLSKEKILTQTGDQQQLLDWAGNEVQGEISNEPVSSTTLYPTAYLHETDYFNTVSAFIKEKFEHEPIELIEYTEYQGFIFISYYIYNNQKLANLLKVFDANGKVLVRETLGSELKGIGINTFLISGNQLIFTKNKTEVSGLLIE